MGVTTKRLSLTDYLNYSDETDTCYELVNGELIPMGLGTGRHGELGKRLVQMFDQESDRTGHQWTALQSVVGVQSPRGEKWETVRIPDVLVLPKEQWRTLQNQEAVIRLGDSPPVLVVEVVSPSSQSIDYRAKRSEYSVLDIPEYWVIDPLEEKVTVFTLSEGWYDEAVFTGEARIISPTYPDFPLTVTQLLQGEI
ncbi:Uma2 family endonuclease [Spirulina sp. CS-785/01]|uniref:Uma2 family endonuclease n=1 Tax=Spirulina sp. CS-785/01 TaxID=3021716 RepID=UPI00232CEDD4|nr:Uma2 family endonuclease [Spirulina sp. CS-785/01]MDB9313037.1 Uma2 family endonuclease [Spirulina sp. CS-785/01]